MKNSIKRVVLDWTKLFGFNQVASCQADFSVKPTSAIGAKVGDKPPLSGTAIGARIGVKVGTKPPLEKTAVAVRLGAKAGFKPPATTD